MERERERESDSKIHDDQLVYLSYFILSSLSKCGLSNTHTYIPSHSHTHTHTHTHTHNQTNREKRRLHTVI